jgi:drug/metabolite transporter (DMT)-like permease
MSPDRRTAEAYALLMLVALFWAGNTVVGRAVYQDLPPLGFAFWRCFAAFLVLAPFGLPRLWRARAVVRAHLGILVALGFLGMAAFSALVFVGLRYTEAVNGALIQGTLTVNILLVSLVLLGTPVAARQAAGVVVAMAGLAAIVARGEIATLLGLRLNIGDLLMWLGVVAHALYSVLLAQRPKELDLIGFMTAAFMFGSLILAPFHVWESLDGRPMPVNVTAALAVGFVALFPSVVAQLFWAEAVGRVGATAAGYFIYLTPVFGAAMAIAFLSETPAWFHAAGIALIFAGIYLATAARHRPA